VIYVLANSGVPRGITWTQQLGIISQVCEDFSSLIFVCFCMHVLLFSSTLIILFSCDLLAFFGGGEHKKVMVMTRPRPKGLAPP
jgi:hypothetical protein